MVFCIWYNGNGLLLLLHDCIIKFNTKLKTILYIIILCRLDGVTASQLQLTFGDATKDTGISDTIHVSGVQMIIIHQNYSYMVNDIALLKLSTPVESYSQEVRPVCMPHFQDAADPPPYDNCWVAGWGLLSG